MLLTLVGVKWADDLAVSGMVRWTPQSGAVTATLTMVGPGGATGDMSASWNARMTDALAEVSGFFDGQVIAAVLPAP